MKRVRTEYGASCDTIIIGSDHAGYALKTQIIDYLKKGAAYKDRLVTIVDVGTTSESNRVDYPDMAEAVCTKVLQIPTARGILLDGAGIASGIAANKFTGIRAAVVHDHFSISMGRKHNDCNVACLGGKTIGIEAAKEILDVFILCPFEGERHLPRLAKLEALEQLPSHPVVPTPSSATSSPFRLPK